RAELVAAGLFRIQVVQTDMIAVTARLARTLARGIHRGAMSDIDAAVRQRLVDEAGLIGDGIGRVPDTPRLRSFIIVEALAEIDLPLLAQLRRVEDIERLVVGPDGGIAAGRPRYAVDRG